MEIEIVSPKDKESYFLISYTNRKFLATNNGNKGFSWTYDETKSIDPWCLIDSDIRNDIGKIAWQFYETSVPLTYYIVNGMISKTNNEERAVRFLLIF